MSKDYGYFGSGSSGYHQYMTSFNHNFGDGGSTDNSVSDYSGGSHHSEASKKTTEDNTSPKSSTQPQSDNRSWIVEFVEWVKESKADKPFKTWLAVIDVILLVVVIPALCIIKAIMDLFSL